MKIEVIFEKRLRISEEYEVTEEQLNEFLNGDDTSITDDIAKKVGNGDIKYDFAVINKDTGKTILDWD